VFLLKKAVSLLIMLTLLAGCAGGSKPEGSSTGEESSSSVESLSPASADVLSADTSDPKILGEFVFEDFVTNMDTGCMATGKLQSGELSQGDLVYIVRDDNQLLQMFITEIQILSADKEEPERAITAQAGQDVNLVLPGEGWMMVEGDRLVKYASSPDDPDKEVVLTAEEIRAELVKIEEYIRTGDIKLLDYLTFKEDKNRDGFKALLEDPTARELWCAAYVPTVWHLPEVEGGGRFQPVVKSPEWAYIYRFHAVLSGCEPMSEKPEAIKSYFEKYAEQIPYHYSRLSFEQTDGKVTMNGEDLVYGYIGYDSLAKAVSNPLYPFTELIGFSEFTGFTTFTTELPPLDEEQTLLTQYYQLIADNKFFEAIDLAEGTLLELTNMPEITTMTPEQKAKLQAEVDKYPKGEFYQYSQAGGGNHLALQGELITYRLLYDEEFEGLGVGMPIPVKRTHGDCYPTTLHSAAKSDHFGILFDIINHQVI